MNISVWDSVEHAQQMDSLKEMKALFVPFTTAGVAFERPIVNYALDWQINLEPAEAKDREVCSS